MKLYHGSIDIVRKSEIRVSTRRIDYGDGFYATTSFVQAETWAKRRLKDKSTSKGFVNVYDFDEQGSKALQVFRFASPTDEWIDFLMANRTHKGFTHNYNLVYGPVANDRVFLAFTLYEGAIIGKVELLKRLKTYKLVNQYLFHTEKSLHFLNYLYYKEIHL